MRRLCRTLLILPSIILACIFYANLNLAVAQNTTNDDGGLDEFLKNESPEIAVGAVFDGVEAYGKYSGELAARVVAKNADPLANTVGKEVVKKAGRLEGLGKWGGVIASTAFEVPEIVEGFEKDGLRGAGIEAVGAVTNVGIGTIGGGAVIAGASKCAVAGATFGAAGGPIGAAGGGALAFGVCYFGGQALLSYFANKGEDLIEARLKGILGSPGDGQILSSRLFGRQTDINGGVYINVSIDGAVTTSATGGKSKATSNVGIADAGNTRVIVNVEGAIATTATGRSEARSDVGVASGQGASVIVNVDGAIVTTAAGASKAQTDVGKASGRNSRVIVDVDGTIITTATGRSTSTTEVGIASGDNSSAIVSVEGAVVTTATGRSDARTELGIASGDGSRVVVNTDGSVVTSASGRATSSTEIGVARGSGASVSVNIDGSISTVSTGRASANTEVGVANEGHVSTSVGGNVLSIASGRAQANTEIGTSNGMGSSAHVGGAVATIANGKSATTAIGRNGSAYVGGAVINQGGEVTVGGASACPYTRNKQCCLALYIGRCVTKITPSVKGACPPGWHPVFGVCYWIPDYNHFIRP